MYIGMAWGGLFVSPMAFGDALIKTSISPYAFLYAYNSTTFSAELGTGRQ